MLRGILENRALQEWAERMGLGVWRRLLVARHDMGTWDKMRRVFGRREDPFRFRESEYEALRLERMLSLLRERRYGRALDLGCAEGDFTRLLAPLCGEVVAVDISRKAVERAGKTGGPANVRWVCANIRHWRPEGRFDLIVAGEVLYYLGAPHKGPAFEKAFEEWAAAFLGRLEPGGRLLVANGFGTPEDLERNEDYARRLERLGLRALRAETVGQGAADAGGMLCRITLFER